MKTEYEILPELFLRAPYYSYAGYDPERLPAILADPSFRNALWLASRAFYEQLRRKDFDHGRLTAKEQFSLLKYYNRMCFRPTPFGSFASFSLGKWSEEGPARLSPDSRATLHLLPDLQWLDMAAGTLRAGGPGELLTLNPALYLVGTEYRFARSAPGKKGKLNFSIEAIPAEPLNAGLIAYCKKGPVTALELAEWIQVHSGCSGAEAAGYVDFLADSQVLFRNDKAPLIGGERCRLSVLPESIRNSLASIREYPFTCSPSLVATAIEIEKLLPGNVLSDIPVFYSALERKWETGGPDARDGEELCAAIIVLRRFTTPGPPAALAQFIEGFRARFDQRKVPLLEALDPDSGIVYGRPARAANAPGPIDNIRFPAAGQPPLPGEWTANHRLLFSRWAEAKQHGPYTPVTVLPGDAGEGSGPLPPTLAVMFRKTEEHLLIEYAGGASATSLVGRFSAFSKETLELCRTLAALESAANPDVLFADVDQRSDLHADNINRREKIYEHCININAFATGTGLLALDDLQLSVRGGELLLESRSLGKRVIPRLATAYNYRLSGLGISRLLCDLQYQGGGALLPFSMEHFFPGLRFYPRVEFRQTILCPAKWKFGTEDVAVLLDPAGGEARERMRRFRKENGLPIKVSLGDFDQQLVFDLSNEQEHLFFLDCIRGLENITLHEYLQPARRVKSGDQPLAGQFIAFLYHNRRAYKCAPSAASQLLTGEKRDFLLGDEWLYLKIYCTPQVADQLLGAVLPLFISQQEQELFCWFFIRYNEEGDHLRLRFKTRPALIGRLLVNFLAILRLTGMDRLIRNYQGDTYQRELERYPPELIGLVENVFREGSALVCSRLSHTGTTPGGTAEFLFGLETADWLLRSFLKPGEISNFCAAMLENFSIEFGGGKVLKTDMDGAYRKLRTEIENTLTKKRTGEERLTAAPILAKAASQMPAGERSMLLADIIHMQMNRNFQARQRQQEFFVYYCILKHWSSVQAKARHSS